MKLTPAMRTALEHAARQPLRRLHDDQPGKPLWPAPAATLYALVRHGLLEHGRRRNRRGWPLDEWTVTDAGRQALEPVVVVKQDVPLYQAHCGSIRYRKLPNGRWAVDTSGDGKDDYTTSRFRSFDELEVLPPGVVDAAWFGAAVRRHAEAQDRRERARRLANSRKAA